MVQSDAVRDRMSRYFVPARRVVAAERADRPEILPGCRTLRAFTAHGFPVCTVAQGGFVVLDFGSELSGGVRIVTGYMKPCRVRLRFGESLAEACGQPDMTHAIHDIELPLTLFSATDFGNTGFRFVRLDVQEGELALVNLMAAAAVRDLETVGSFHSSDARLDAVFAAAVRTIHLNIQELILDGVKRDRLPWGGDMHPETAVILRVFGAIPEIAATLEQLCFHTAPGEFVNGHTENPLWLLWTLRDLWLHGGDRALLEHFAPFVTTSVEHCLAMVRADGTAEFPGYVFLDWPSSGDPAAVHAGVVGLLALALRSAMELFRELGLDPAPAAEALARLKRRVPEPGRNKGAAALQHLAGLADRRAVLTKELFSGVGTFLGYYVLQALDGRAALELVKTYWGGMLAMGATTFWEDFDLAWLREHPTRIDEMPVAGRKNIHADFGAYCYKGLRHSLCHGWASGPAAWCSKRILGVEPLRPGFAALRFAPNLCGLEYAEGSVPTPHGAVRVRLEAGKKPEITAPAGVEVRYEATEAVAK